MTTPVHAMPDATPALPMMHCDPHTGCPPLEAVAREVTEIKIDLATEEQRRREDIRDIHSKIDKVLAGIILLLIAAVVQFLMSKP